MNRPFRHVSLGVQLTCATFLSFLVAVGSFWALQSGSTHLLDNVLANESFTLSRSQKVVGDFQAFVSREELSSQDYDAITRWVNAQSYLFLSIYRGGTLVYDSAYSDMAVLQQEAKTESYLQPENTFPVYFTDACVGVDVYFFYNYRYYEFLNYVCLAVAFLFFVLMLLLFIRRKTRYLNHLANELRILESGNLSYAITVKGHDELASLAVGIDSMRQSVIDRLQSEEEAHRANSGLVTAMSHDLRTPLTALMGYLDIVENHKYHTQEQLFQYIHNSREKAYQIKTLSDKLFEYFLVFSRDREVMELETYSGNELLAQIVGESIFDMEDRGFTVRSNLVEHGFQLNTNVEYLRRVFSNVFSNLTKYADPACPVDVLSVLEENRLRITVTNRILPTPGKVESTGIGLKTCEKIMKLMNGQFQVRVREEEFTVTLCLPAL